MPNPNYELLKEAYAIIGGIPDSVINLNSIQDAKGESLSCGTICCAAGWLGHHPMFQALGMRTEESGALTMHGKWSFFERTVATVFGIDECQAIDLFGARGDSRFDEKLSKRLSHKRVWMARMRMFLAEHGQLKKQLAAKQTARELGL